MKNASKGYRPPVNFFFAVSVLGKTSARTSNVDAAFQEVSGISATQEFDSVKEGGENRFVHKLPGRITYDNLVLKRGLVVWPSPLGLWCRKLLSSGTNTIDTEAKIEPKDLMVQLLDGNKKKPIMAWFFSKAQPLKWEIGALDAQTSKISIETLTLTYQFFKTVEHLGNDFLTNQQKK